MLEIRIHGYGGQGAVTLAHLLAQAALDSGSRAQALPSFGVERRGAPVQAAVRISDEQIMVYSQSAKPNVLVCMGSQLVDAGLSEGYSEDCVLVVNSSEPVISDRTVYCIDAKSMAEDADLIAGGIPMVNIPLLGAITCTVDIPFNVLEQTLRKNWAGDAGEKNVNAARLGYDSVMNQREG